MVKNTLGQLDLSILPSSVSLEWIGVLLRFRYSLILNISWKEWCLTLIFACMQKNKTIKWSILIWSRSAPGMLYVEQIWVFLKRLSSDFHFFLCRQSETSKLRVLVLSRPALACSHPVRVFWIRQTLLKQTSREY